MKCSHHAVKPEYSWKNLKIFELSGVRTKTQNLKMKELVSAAAVSLRHARAQVFSFWPFFFFVDFYVNTSDDELVPLFCTNYHSGPGGALWFLVSFVGFWCSIQSMKLLAVLIQAEPCSVWWFLFHLLLIPFESKSWKHFCSPFLSWACLICTSPILS